jgi:hypothetical protein
MNYYVVALGIILLILVYILYRYFTVTASTLSTFAKLNSTNPPIAINSINSPTNVSYAYGTWVYINDWNNSANNVIFSRDNNIVLYLKKGEPTLCCDILMNNDTWKQVIITNNFPIQAWTCIVVSIDGYFLDAYLNGKLITSQQLIDGTSIPKTPDNSSGINIGYSAISPVNSNVGTGTTTNTNFNASIANFQRWTAPLDPQTVWTTYLQGNGQSSAISGYGINLDILQNNVTQSTYQLL